MKSLIKCFGILFASVQIIHSQPVSWTMENSPTSQNLYGVAQSDTSLWVAVGSGGTMIRSVDEGINWSLISSPVTDQLRSVSLPGYLGLAVATKNTVEQAEGKNQLFLTKLAKLP